MLCVVLDTNVYVSALIKPDGIPAQIIQAFVKDDLFRIIITEPIIEELRKTLRYSKVRKYIKCNDRDLELWMAALLVRADFIRTYSKVELITKDSTDDKYIEAAIDSNAAFIITGDSHLLEYRSYQGIRIITPKEFFRIIEVIKETLESKRRK